MPFTTEQFIAIFVSYNISIWPAQVGAYLLGSAAVILLLWKTSYADRITAGILTVMWLWTGIAYHGMFFGTINPAAYLFGAMFLIQGTLLLYSGVYHDRLRFGLGTGPMVWVGFAFVIYAAVLYPLIGMWAGHVYPEMPTFGVTPCPVTIFTFGMFLLTTKRLSRWLLIIPFSWSLIGGSAAVLLSVPQDWVLLFSGFIAIPLIIMQGRAQDHRAASSRVSSRTSSSA